MLQIKRKSIFDLEFDKRVIDIIDIVINHYKEINKYSILRDSDISCIAKIKVYKNQSLIVSIKFQQLILEDNTIVHFFSDKMAGFELRNTNYVEFLTTIKNLYEGRVTDVD